MKKLFLIFFVMFFIFSCSKENIDNLIENWSWKIWEAESLLESSNEKLDEGKWIVDDTKDTINEYVDTLESSIGDAKEVRDLYNQKANELQDELRNVVK